MIDKFLFILIFLISISSCQTKSTEKHDLDKAIDAAAMSKNAKDPLFLGFDFSMDSIATLSKISELEESGKLKYSSDGNLRYNFDLGVTAYNTAIGLTYDNDTLSSINIVFFNENGFTIDLIKNQVAANITSTFSEKGYTSYIDGSIPENTDYYWIKNNVIVSIKSYKSFVILSYKNAIIEKKNKIKDELDKNERKEQTLSDI